MKKNFVDITFKYHTVVIFICCMLIAAGIAALSVMKKNEFPEYTVRNGVVAAVYPGATSQQVEKEVTEPLEDFIFRYKEVDKNGTTSVSLNGMSIVIVKLNDEYKDAPAFWTAFKHNINDFKLELPSGVVATRVIDDFGECTARLITISSSVKTYPQLEEYAEQMRKRLRTLDDVSRISIIGMRHEQISVKINPEQLHKYALNRKAIIAAFAANSFTTVSGSTEQDDVTHPIYVDRSTANEYDVAEMVIADDAVNGKVRLKDIATVTREYPAPESTITDNGKKCLLVSVEMKKDKDIVAMGRHVDEVVDDYVCSLPKDVETYTITNQSQVVEESVTTFIMELLTAIISVILVVVILLPIRTALVSASTIPITVFISIAAFWAGGLELNTITLCLLILTLGMIVHDASVSLYAYLERIRDWATQHQAAGEIGKVDIPDEVRHEASVWAAKHYFPSVLSATLAITATYFPMLSFTRGILNDFTRDFPWGITIILFISLFIAQILVPYLQYHYIKRPVKKDSPFLDGCQKFYNKAIVWCFAHKVTVLTSGVATVVLGIILTILMPMRLIPWAERHQFVVEIYTPYGTTLEKTSAIADSLERMMRRESRIERIVSFKGCSSPRFHSTYAPGFGGSNYAQFIVNTTGTQETVELINELEPKYREYFPEAFVRFRQLSYSPKDYPVEVAVECDDMDSLRRAADSIKAVMAEIPNLEKPRSSVGNFVPSTHVTMRPAEAARYNVHNALLSTALAGSFSSGIKVASLWDDGKDLPVVFTSEHGTDATIEDIEDETVPTLLGAGNVQLHQVADVSTQWEEATINHIGGKRIAMLSAEFKRECSGNNGIRVVDQIEEKIKDRGEHFLPADTKVTYYGDYDDFNTYMPGILMTLLCAAIINLFIILIHFRKVKTAVLLLACFPMTLLGTAVGIIAFGVEFGTTPVLGMVTLLGMLVRNCTIMLDYTEQLRADGIDLCSACIQSAQRRMRPIMLTSLCASIGVIPMILSQNTLWMPMGVVICVGTVFTMFSIIFFIPVAYYLINKRQ